MKTDFLRKAKWYIIGFILIAIMLSVSLSFCAWDTLSIKAKLMSNGSGGYIDKYRLIEDSNNNGLADVGDVLVYGNYYQDSNDTVKSPIKWIVVDKTANPQTGKIELSVISQKILAYGSFFGGTYTKDNTWGASLFNAGTTYIGSHNYTISTARVWLNLDGTDKYVRTDKNTPLSINSADGVAFRGFYNEAFTEKEKLNIIPKTISNIRGAGIYIADTTYVPPIENYPTISDKVWIPSYSEVFGAGMDWSDSSDGLPNKQFQYFKDNTSRIARTTNFASSNLSNYTTTGMQPSWTANWGNTKGGDAGLWALRSPNPLRGEVLGSRHLIYVNALGNSVFDAYWAVDSLYGIRPAIILPM